MSPSPSIQWPPKHDLFGVQISATRYDEVVDKVLEAAERGQRALVDFAPVHVLIPAVRDPQFGKRLNAFDIVAPDGQPVRWALNCFHNTGLTDRVYGPELTRRLCKAAAERGVSIYLYGSTPQVLEALQKKLLSDFPALIIAGAESPPFRPLTPEEDAAAVRRINASGAKLLFLGTGSPRQEIFAYEHREQIHAVQLCVGAAFDFHAGAKKTAPAWMQRRGLEWLFRLWQEPGRLWKRYLTVNSTFVFLFLRELIRRRIRRAGAVAAPAPVHAAPALEGLAVPPASRPSRDARCDEHDSIRGYSMCGAVGTAGNALIRPFASAEGRAGSSLLGPIYNGSNSDVGVGR